MALTPYGDMITGVSAALPTLLAALDRGDEAQLKTAIVVVRVLQSHIEGLMGALVDRPGAFTPSPDLDMGELVTGLEAAGLNVITLGWDDDE